MNMITNGDTVCELDYDGMEVLSALDLEAVEREMQERSSWSEL